MKRVRGEHAWVVLGLLVIAYEIVANDGELLSEAVDRFIEKHPIATRLAVAGVAMHLANVAPNRIDPLHMLFTVTRTYRLGVRSCDEHYGGGHGRRQAS